MMQFDHPSRPGRRGSHKTVVIVLLAAVIVALSLAVAAFFYFQSAKKIEKAATISKPSKEETVNRVIDKVSKLYQLPEEDGTVARVGDQEKLDGQPFFENAKVGDYVIVFPKSKLALIYRESTDKIINVGPVSVDQETAQ